MNRFLRAAVILLVPLFVVATAPLGNAQATDTPDDLTTLRSEVRQLRVELDALRAATRSAWTHDAREAEVRAIVDAALADADTRAAYQGLGLFGGYDGKNFHLAGEGFDLKLSGQLQFRYVHNTDDNGSGDSEHADGFELRRAKVQFAGHIADPKITYVVRLASSRNSGDTSLEEARVGYTFDNGVQLFVGKMKLPFLRQELLSSSRQLAVDRSLGTEFFTLNFAEQVKMVVPIGDNWRVALAYSDGGVSESSGALTDPVEYAFTARGDGKLGGAAWADAKDVRPLKDGGSAWFLGAAVHAEQREATGDASLGWTADVLSKHGHFTALLAYIGGHDDSPDRTVHGLTAQAGYAVHPDWQPFVGYDLVVEDGVDGDLQAVTAGVNRFFKGHAAKLTADVVWVFNGDAPGSITGLNSAPLNTGIGLRSSAGEQVAARAQFQLLF